MGFIYILNNKSLAGQIKVGYTDRDVENRAKELSSSTSIPTKFNILYQWEVENAREVERMIHEKISCYRITKRREFFSDGCLAELVKYMEVYCLKEKHRFELEELERKYSCTMEDDQENIDDEVVEEAEDLLEEKRIYESNLAELVSLERSYKSLAPEQKFRLIQLWDECGFIDSIGVSHYELEKNKYSLDECIEGFEDYEGSMTEDEYIQQCIDNYISIKEIFELREHLFGKFKKEIRIYNDCFKKGKKRQEEMIIDKLGDLMSKLDSEDLEIEHYVHGYVHGVYEFDHLPLHIRKIFSVKIGEDQLENIMKDSLIDIADEIIQCFRNICIFQNKEDVISIIKNCTGRISQLQKDQWICAIRSDNPKFDVEIQSFLDGLNEEYESNKKPYFSGLLSKLFGRLKM